MVWEKHPMWYMVFTIARKWRFIFAKSKHIFYNKFKDVLTKEGITEIPAKGEKFDLNKHEAMMVQESEDVENGYIIEELMKGYMYKDKVLKYSKVIVCKK